MLLVFCAGLLEGLRQAVPLVEPLCETSRSRRSSHAASCIQQPISMSSANLPSRSPSEDELGRMRHAAWQELPPELVALILCRASVRERKLCEQPLMALVARIELYARSSLWSIINYLCQSTSVCTVVLVSTQCLLPCLASPWPVALHSKGTYAGCAGRLVCKGWRRGVDMLVTRLQVGPHNRDQQPWNRQLLMLQKLPSLFPCLGEINFDQVMPSLSLAPCHGLLSSPPFLYMKIPFCAGHVFLCYDTLKYASSSATSWVRQWIPNGAADSPSTHS